MYLVENCCGTQLELSLVLCDNLEWDGGGVGEGRRFKRKGTYVHV